MQTPPSADDQSGETATKPVAAMPTDYLDALREMQRLADEGLAGPESQLFQQEMGILRQILGKAVEDMSNVTDMIENPELLRIHQETLEFLQLVYKTTVPRHEINPKTQ